jgi:peroxiredoxin
VTKPSEVDQADPSKGLGWLLGVAVLAMGGALILFGQGSAPPLHRGDLAPDFTLSTSGDNRRVSLTDYSGQVVLVNFWATWCKPCEDEMPAMERLYQQMAPLGFELLAVSVDQDQELVSAFVERQALTFPILLDSEQVVTGVYQTMGFPESLLLDRRGRIVERYVGPKPWDQPEYVDRIQRLLNEPS